MDIPNGEMELLHSSCYWILKTNFSMASDGYFFFPYIFISPLNKHSFIISPAAKPMFLACCHGISSAKVVREFLQVSGAVL